MKLLLALACTTCLMDNAAAADTHTVTLAAGKGHEACMDLKSGDRLEYGFSASNKLAFNLHFHDGDRVEMPVPESLQDKVPAGSHVAAITQHYCLMWTNPHQSASQLAYRYQVVPAAQP
ncbi:hypothetical protein [Chitinimonas sp. BJYL2]|uniref:hypothetical protein n=1 Tax=Chitinimonas sp. BJYL2 TaxID=2976696 RepID=UPI0022B5A6FC|nr:hypothetical protein [Chitinimonas sp. BJYL2]